MDPPLPEGPQRPTYSDRAKSCSKVLKWLMVVPLPDSSSFKEGEADLHQEDDDAHDDQEEGVRVEHQDLQARLEGRHRRVQARHLGVDRRLV